MYSCSAVSVSRGGGVTAGVVGGGVPCACAVPAQAQKAIGATKMANTVENRGFVAIGGLSYPHSNSTLYNRAASRRSAAHCTKKQSHTRIAAQVRTRGQGNLIPMMMPPVPMAIIMMTPVVSVIVVVPAVSVIAVSIIMVMPVICANNIIAIYICRFRNWCNGCCFRSLIGTHRNDHGDHNCPC